MFSNDGILIVWYKDKCSQIFIIALKVKRRTPQTKH